MFKRVHNGIDIPKNKERSKDKKIQVIESPRFLYFPMAMHIGAPAQPVVDIGDRVKIGSLIGEKDGPISANIHSSVSGHVIGIVERPSFRGQIQTIVIENDYKDERVALEPLDETSTIDDLVKRLEDCGITGKGGAGFPTSVKFQEDKDTMDYLLVNGAECEPYSTTDHRIMVEYADQLVEAMVFIKNLYEIDQSYIGVEGHMKEPIDLLRKAAEDKGLDHLHIYELPSAYPQGHSGLQVREILGIEIEEDERTGDVGVLQMNVSTLKAIYDSIFEGRPFTSRVVTVTGPFTKEPKNLMVPIGTSVSYLLQETGLIVDYPDDDLRLISGGPMMGSAFSNLIIPVDKDTTTILAMKALEDQPQGPCIRCARCIDVCPVNLEPVLISEAYDHKETYMAGPLKSQSCISCGSCTYICPARIPLLDNIQSLNADWEEAQSE